MEDRFIVVQKEGSSFGVQRRILVDRRTGVNYLWIREGYGGGLTVLVNTEGKPLVSRIDADK